MKFIIKNENFFVKLEKTYVKYLSELNIYSKLNHVESYIQSD